MKIPFLRKKIIPMKIPCEECITMVICKREILNNIERPVRYLRDKCELFKDFVKNEEPDNFKHLVSYYPILEECFKLNFEIEGEQFHRRWKSYREKEKKRNEKYSM